VEKISANSSVSDHGRYRRQTDGTGRGEKVTMPRKTEICQGYGEIEYRDIKFYNEGVVQAILFLCLTTGCMCPLFARHIANNGRRWAARLCLLYYWVPWSTCIKSPARSWPFERLAMSMGLLHYIHADCYSFSYCLNLWLCFPKTWPMYIQQICASTYLSVFDYVILRLTS